MPGIGKLKEIRQGEIRILGVSSDELHPARAETGVGRELQEIRQGEIHILGVSSGTVRPARVETAIVHFGVDPYEGPYEVTPGPEAQILRTKDLRMTGNVTVNPIPSNYGLITWDGSKLRVS